MGCRVFLDNEQSPSGFNLWALLKLAVAQAFRHRVVPRTNPYPLDRITELNICDVGREFSFINFL